MLGNTSDVEMNSNNVVLLAQSAEAAEYTGCIPAEG